MNFSMYHICKQIVLTFLHTRYAPWEVRKSSLIIKNKEQLKEDMSVTNTVLTAPVFYSHAALTAHFTEISIQYLPPNIFTMAPYCLSPYLLPCFYILLRIFLVKISFPQSPSLFLLFSSIPLKPNKCHISLPYHNVSTVHS